MTSILREYLQSICILLAFLVPLVVFHISKKYVQATGERTEGRIATPSAGLVPIPCFHYQMHLSVPQQSKHTEIP